MASWEDLDCKSAIALLREFNNWRLDLDFSLDLEELKSPLPSLESGGGYGAAAEVEEADSLSSSVAEESQASSQTLAELPGDIKSRWMRKSAFAEALSEEERSRLGFYFDATWMSFVSNDETYDVEKATGQIYKRTTNDDGSTGFELLEDEASETIFSNFESNLPSNTSLNPVGVAVLGRHPEQFL